MDGHTGESTTAELIPARIVADRLGNAKRTVLSWRVLGCPHTNGEWDGRQCVLFPWVELLEWGRERGVIEGEVGLTDEDDPDDDKSLDLSDVGSKLEQLIARVLQLRPKSTDPAAFQRMASAIKQAASELRALEEARWKREERERTVIARAEAETVVAELARTSVEDLGTLETDLPRIVIGALSSEGIEIPSHESAERLIASRISSRIETLRRRRADALRGSSDKLGTSAA